MSPQIIAHRGASADAPENTLAAFVEAWRQGADGIETDVRLTADGHVVCIHDEDTWRCGDRRLKVADTCLDELQMVDVGAWKDPSFSKQRIPMLWQVLAMMPTDRQIFIEIKDGLPSVEPVCRVVADSGVDPSRVVFMAFAPDVVAACRRVMPAPRANWLTAYRRDPDGAITPSLAEVIETLGRIDASGLGSHADPAVVTSAFVQRLCATGFGVHCWTVNDLDQAAALIHLRVDSITTDQPAAILQERATGRWSDQ